MEVFRLVRDKYALPLTGKGAALFGARWNSRGVELIYTAMNRSLAMAEVAVHFSWSTLPEDYVMLTLEIPDQLEVATIEAKQLPKQWRSFPHPAATQKVGDSLVRENKYVALKIPSVVTQGDFNVLINPAHPKFKKIKVVEKVAFPFDARLVR